jgi:hypothetical protein
MYAIRQSTLTDTVTDYNFNNIESTTNSRMTTTATTATSNGLSSSTASVGGGGGKPCPAVADADAAASAVLVENNNNSGSNGDKTATVMAMATGYSLLDYQHFVGSLRKTGFGGNIILAVAPNLDEKIEEYLKSKNVIIKKVQYVKCSHGIASIKKELSNKTLDEIEDHHDRELVTCLHPYSNLKHRWGKFFVLFYTHKVCFREVYTFTVYRERFREVRPDSPIPYFVFVFVFSFTFIVKVATVFDRSGKKVYSTVGKTKSKTKRNDTCICLLLLLSLRVARSHRPCVSFFLTQTFFIFFLSFSLPSKFQIEARFPLLRDYLIECGDHPTPEIQCGGPVLITDMRDTIFQRNPFGNDAPTVNGLQVFQEFYTVRTTHWLVDWPVGDCKGVHYNEPMLCSGTTIGTRNAMIDYLNIMQIEMYEWMSSPKCCCFDTNGDDQSMHNYLYYSGKLNSTSVRGGVHSIINRMGIINTVGAQASLILESHTVNRKAYHTAKNEDIGNSHNDPYDLSRDEEGKDEDHHPTQNDNNNNNEGGGGHRKNWLGLQYGLTDDEGYFLDMNGQRSYAVHQYDRFGGNYYEWIKKNKYKLFLDER